MSMMDFAIQMEIDGERFYLKQAEVNKDNPLQVVFVRLAKAESRHARLLRNRMADVAGEYADDPLLKDAKTVFSELGALKKDVFGLANQLDAYRLAQDLEQKSIDLYTAMLAEATDTKGREIMKFLIGQEQEHYNLLDELITLVTRPNEWVESAEFGNREEY